MSVRVRIVGNSFAIPINKRVCRLLRIDNTTRVDMRMIGDRLVFEIVGRGERVLTHDQISYLMRHVERSNMTDEQFARLSGGETTLRTFLIVCSVRGHIGSSLARRLFSCFERRRVVTESWDATIDAVLAGIPGPIDDEDFHSIPPDRLASEISTKIEEDSAGGPAATARREYAASVVQQALDGLGDDSRADELVDDDRDGQDVDGDDVDGDDVNDFKLDESLYTTSPDDESWGEPVEISL